MDVNKIDLEKITGFAGARFSDCIENKSKKNAEKDPLHKLFESGTDEMFEGTENFTWISEE